MALTYEKDNEWGGFTIDLESEGFLVKYHAHNKGELDGLHVLVPYGTWGFTSVVDLEASFDDVISNGEALAAMALDDMKQNTEMRRVKELDVAAAPPMRDEEAAVTESGERKTRYRWEGKAKRKEAGISWYTFSAKKIDEDAFGNCHDLFGTMYYRHGMPAGMALWVNSDPMTEGNVFFVQVPDDVYVKEDRLFERFPFRACDRPSKIGLMLLEGNPRTA